MLEYKNRIDLSLRRPLTEKIRTAFLFILQELNGVSKVLVVILVVFAVNLLINLVRPNHYLNTDEFSSFFRWFYLIEGSLYYILPVIYITAYAVSYQNKFTDENFKVNFYEVIELLSKNNFYPIRILFFYFIPFFIVKFLTTTTWAGGYGLVFVYYFLIIIFYSNFVSVSTLVFTQEPSFLKIFKRKYKASNFFLLIATGIIINISQVLFNFLLNQVLNVSGLVGNLGDSYVSLPFKLVSILLSLFIYLMVMALFLVFAMQYFEKHSNSSHTSFLDREIEQIGKGDNFDR